jgi:hypothetical protein
MSSQNERNLDSLLNEIRELKDRMRGILPLYNASLKELSRLPDEFECRFWASCFEALLEKVRVDYQRYQARAQEANLLGNFMTMGMNTVFKAGGMEPIPLPDSLRVGISISPSGKIEPTLIDDPNKQGAILVNCEEFTAIAQRLKDQLLKGTVVPSSEDEIPKLVYDQALKSP